MKKGDMLLIGAALVGGYYLYTKMKPAADAAQGGSNFIGAIEKGISDLTGGVNFTGQKVAATAGGVGGAMLGAITGNRYQAGAASVQAAADYLNFATGTRQISQAAVPSGTYYYSSSGSSVASQKVVESAIKAVPANTALYGYTPIVGGSVVYNTTPSPATVSVGRIVSPTASAVNDVASRMARGLM
jgi:hypothetical protein